jgi:hypothetical protein
MKIAMLVLMVVAARARALDLKGVVLGQVASEAQLAALGCLPVRFGSATCATSLGDVPVQIQLSLAADQSVETLLVRFAVEQVQAIERAGAAKWGKPQVDSMPLQNGFGAKVILHMWIWKEASGANATLYSQDPEHADKGILLLSAHAAKAGSVVL